MRSNPGLAVVLLAAWASAACMSEASETGASWWQLRQRACEDRSARSYQVADYDERLAMREIMRRPDGAADDQPDWGDIRPRLDDHAREWIVMRTQACVEDRAELGRCLDEQARTLARRVSAWAEGDPSWKTDQLDDAIPAPRRCLE